MNAVLVRVPELKGIIVYPPPPRGKGAGGASEGGGGPVLSESEVGLKNLWYGFVKWWLALRFMRVEVQFVAPVGSAPARMEPVIDGGARGASIVGGTCHQHGVETSEGNWKNSFHKEHVDCSFQPSGKKSRIDY